MSLYPEGTAPSTGDNELRALEKILECQVALKQAPSGLAPAAGTYDNIVLDPPAQPTTITYKLGSDTVATLTLTYSGSDVATITRS